MKKPAKKASTKRSARRPMKDLTAKKGAGVKGGQIAKQIVRTTPTPTPDTNSDTALNAASIARGLVGYES